MRLVRIDLRRGGGVWLVPVAVLSAWLILRNALTPGVALWPEITSTISMMAMPLIFLAGVLGGVAGARERRRAVGELAGGTAMPGWQRYLSLSISIFLWALAMYVIFAVPLMVYGASRATWGGPEIGVLVVTIPIMALGAVFGVLIGRIVSGRSSPVLAFALFMLLFVVLPMADPFMSWLSVIRLNGWFDAVVEGGTVRPFSVIAQLAWGIGLTGVVIGAGILWERRTALSSVPMYLSAALAIAGAVTILGAGYREPTTFTSSSARMMDVASGGVCDDSRTIAVCVHPAYQRLLPTYAREINSFLGPVAGLPGVADQVYISSGNEQSGYWSQADDHTVMSIDLSFERDHTSVIFRNLWPMSFMMASTSEAYAPDVSQYVVMTALARDVGVDEWPEWFHRAPANADSPAIEAAIDRFAEMPAEEQRAWLEAHWDDLTYGRLTPEDLP